ncbi:MAG: glycosyltransferase family 2 protein [Thermoanaerobaculia bacterium]
MSIDVSIVVIAHDSESDLPACLAAASAQSGVSTELVVVDNASRDGSREAAESAGARLVALAVNRGFAGGANAGIDATRGRFVLTLNPDCRLDPDFCRELCAALDRPDAADAGSASGKIFRAEGAGLDASRTLDSTGIVFTASGRHRDRDAGVFDSGNSFREAEVAGVTGAAGFFRRAALDSIRISTGFFDEDFFLYREDADLALRLRNAGWRCLYVPGAVAFHRRRNLPERRRSMAPEVNFHSVKNRFLLRLNNSPVPEFRVLPTLTRDLVVLAACLTVERSSLPAFGYLWRNRKRLRAKRSEIKARRASRGGAP